jgi:hypothetical protein
MHVEIFTDGRKLARRCVLRRIRTVRCVRFLTTVLRLQKRNSSSAEKSLSMILRTVTVAIVPAHLTVELCTLCPPVQVVKTEAKKWISSNYPRKTTKKAPQEQSISPSAVES